MKLQDDDFALFGLPQQFVLDRSALDARWRDLQRFAHPDQFSAEGAAAQRLAMQWSVRINEAHQRLKDPLKRAAYLCELAGVPVQAETRTAMPAAFLHQQIEWREVLAQARSAVELDAVRHDVEQERQLRFERCAELLQTQQPALAVHEVRALMFIERFASEIAQRHDDFEQPAGAACALSGRSTRPLTIPAALPALTSS